MRQCGEVESGWAGGKVFEQCRSNSAGLLGFSRKRRVWREIQWAHSIFSGSWKPRMKGGRKHPSLLRFFSHGILTMLLDTEPSLKSPCLKLHWQSQSLWMCPVLSLSIRKWHHNWHMMACFWTLPIDIRLLEESEAYPSPPILSSCTHKSWEIALGLELKNVGKIEEV